MELWQSSGKLVPQQEWESRIGQLHARQGKEYAAKEECITAVQSALVAAVKSRLPSGRFGILFSGGVDSSLLALLAQQLGAGFTCYTIGFHEGALQHPADIAAAEQLAQQRTFPFRKKVYTLGEVEAVIRGAVAILKPTGLADAISVSVAAVIIAAATLAKQDNITEFFGGLGAEEIFAGYHRHTKAADVNAECWRGLKAMWSRDLVRDAAVGKALNITVHTPFLDDQLITAAMRVPAAFKINAQHKKIILREVAEQLGLPEEITWRKKQAAQYGSGFDKALEKLARKDGFRTKGDYLEALAQGRSVR